MHSIGSQTPTECIDKCQKHVSNGKVPNGVTVDHLSPGTHCQCNYDMTTTDGSGTYKSCFIPYGKIILYEFFVIFKSFFSTVQEPWKMWYFMSTFSPLPQLSWSVSAFPLLTLTSRYPSNDNKSSLFHLIKILIKLIFIKLFELENKN